MKRALSAVGILLAAFMVVWATARPSPANAQAKAPGAGGSITTPVTGSSGAFGPGPITTDGGFLMTGAGAVMAEFAGNAGGNYVNKYAGVQLGVNTFGGVWFLGAGTTPNATNYSLMNAGPLLLNGNGTGIILRDSNANKAGIDATYGLYSYLNVGTAGSGTGFSTDVTAAVRPYVHRLTVTRAALTNASTTQDITIWTVSAKTRVWRLLADVTAGFDDAAGPISAVTMTCGKTAGGNEYLLSKSVFTTTQMGTATGEVGASLTTYFGDLPSWSATTAVQCRFTSTGGNLSTLTTGSVTFYLETVVYP